MRRPEFVWTRLHLPRPLDGGRVLALLTNLASDRRSPPLAFEVRADRDGVQHLLGCEATAVQRIKRVLGDHLPGIAMQGVETRQPVREAGRLMLQPPGMPLRVDAPEQSVTSLLSAVGARLQADEVQVVQILLGPRRPPRTVPHNAVAPNIGWWELLTRGTRPPTSDERRQLRQQAEDAGFAACVRVGTTGSDRDRTRHLTVALQSALATTKSTGTRMEFVHEDPRLINSAVLPRRWSPELSVTELLGVLAWPLGDGEYPGMPPLHPKPLRPTPSVHTKDRVFAASLAPGDDRQVGVAPSDALLHGVAYGPTSSGKSTAMLHLIEADMRAGRAIAVLDPKRQLIDDVLARVPAERLDDVVVLDVSSENPIGFNPLDVSGRDPDVVVDGIMAVLGGLFTEGWGPRTLDIFSGTLRTLARASVVTGQPATLADIPRVLTKAPFRRELLAHLNHDEALVEFWAWYESQSPAAQAAAIAAPLNKLRQLLLRPGLVRMLDQRETPFRLRDVWRDNRIVLVPLNEALIGSGTAEMIGSLIVADLWQAVQERASERKPESRPGFVYVDEAPRFLHLPASMADALAVSRSMGVGWWLAAQFAGQFPRELRSAIDMNARTKLVFGTEYDDAAHFARGSKDLIAQDFLSLGKYQAYANLVAAGRPQGWALVRTLPPSARTSRPERVSAHSTARWATPKPSGPNNRPERHGQVEGASRPDRQVVGRKRRSR
ncbi:hypothetical protein KM427_00305 [Nocardioides sp. LMS-CY]|uniref:type IV secretory system conjugative DNA transfer family protein n=1 Tax=Nocardioides sp. (strain LMS-CY) TaxID=2840457 RepID=UPI001C008850|nr:hypothetical protein [Nocardioides sp. LMS-CY]QWF22230.1 hypothetical protein KM427_00305 [Nocardioides sp. LMS-CY]